MNHYQLRVQYQKLKEVALKNQKKAYTLARFEYWQGQIDLLTALIAENMWS